LSRHNQAECPAVLRNFGVRNKHLFNPHSENKAWAGLNTSIEFKRKIVNEKLTSSESRKAFAVG